MVDSGGIKRKSHLTKNKVRRRSTSEENEPKVAESGRIKDLVSAVRLVFI